VLVVLLFAVACSSDDGDGPSAVFSFATDDLCDWIDAATVSSIVEGAYTENGASPIVTGFEESWGSDGYKGCAWSVAGPDPDSDPVVALVGLLEADPLTEAEAQGAAFSPNPALSDGVRADQAADGPIGAHGDFFPGMQVRLAVEGQERTVEFWHGVPPEFDGEADAILAIADGLLRDMGWVPAASD